MFDLNLFRKPTFVGGSIAAFAINGSLYAMFRYLVLYFQNNGRPGRAGDDDLANVASRVCVINRGRVARGVFPPEHVAEVKAIACQLPIEHGVYR